MTKRLGPNKHTHSPDSPRSEGQAGDLARGDPDATDNYNGRESALGGGDSGGGAYPNPHSGKKGGGTGGFMGHGGQTEMPYHGTGQLGEKKTGENANAPARKTGARSD